MHARVGFSSLCTTIENFNGRFNGQFNRWSNFWYNVCQYIRICVKTNDSNPQPIGCSMDRKHCWFSHIFLCIDAWCTKKAHTCFFSVAVWFVLQPTQNLNQKNCWQTDVCHKLLILRHIKLERALSVNQVIWSNLCRLWYIFYVPTVEKSSLIFSCKGSERVTIQVHAIILL